MVQQTRKATATNKPAIYVLSNQPYVPPAPNVTPHTQTDFAQAAPKVVTMASPYIQNATSVTPINTTATYTIPAPPTVQAIPCVQATAMTNMYNTKKYYGYYSSSSSSLSDSGTNDDQRGSSSSSFLKKPEFSIFDGSIPTDNFLLCDYSP